MEGFKQAICTGDWGIPGRYGKANFYPIGHDSVELKKGFKYWIPQDYNCKQEGSLFTEIKEQRGKKDE